MPKGAIVYPGPAGTRGDIYVGGYNIVQKYINSPRIFELVKKMILKQENKRMLKKDEILRLRISYTKIKELVQRYGKGQYNGMLNILIGQINCIDSNENENEKLQYLADSYKRLFIGKGGLGDFIIYEVRNRLNKRLDKEMNSVWEIMKDYI